VVLYSLRFVNGEETADGTHVASERKRGAKGSRIASRSLRKINSLWIARNVAQEC
jgi:hypothetical protein